MVKKYASLLGGLPVETLTHVYNLFIIAYVCIFFSRIQRPGLLLTLHLAATIVYISFQISRNRYSNPLLQISTIWVPLILLSAFHYETGLFNRMIFSEFLDDFVVRMDKAIFGFPPNLFLRGALPSELSAQISHAVYAGFYILLCVPVTLLFIHERKIAGTCKSPREFWGCLPHVQEMLFVIIFTMQCCYLIAVIFPVKGPTDYHSVLFPEPRGMVAAMNILFTNGDLDGGAMPSSHVAGALIVVIYTYKYLRRWFWAVFGIFVLLTISTVYNSYHYASDIIAGLIAGWLFYRMGRALYRGLLFP
jgi:membrane-associated phospholipid phosphatase